MANKLKIELPKRKLFIVADIRKLEWQVSRGEISYSRMVEIMNEMANKFYKRDKEIDFCTFAEWFGRYKLDDENGGYYMHNSSGMEANKLYNILEIYNHYKSIKKL